MPRYEYKVMPAPTRGSGGRQVKGTKVRFAHALSALMNEMGAAGWEYVRADTLPCDDRSGLFRTASPDLPMLIFRRLRGHDVSAVLSVSPAGPPGPLPSPVARDDSLRSTEPPLFKSPTIADVDEDPPAAGSDYDPGGSASYGDEHAEYHDESRSYHDGYDDQTESTLRAERDDQAR